MIVIVIIFFFLGTRSHFFRRVKEVIDAAGHGHIIMVLDGRSSVLVTL